MATYQRKIIRTRHRLDGVDIDTSESQPFDDPTDGLGTLELIEPADTGGTLWAYWSMPV